MNRPKLRIICEGITIWQNDVLVLGEGDTLTAHIEIDGRDRYFHWPLDHLGQPVNPWIVTFDFLKRYGSTTSDPTKQPKAKGDDQEDGSWLTRPAQF